MVERSPSHNDTDQVMAVPALALPGTKPRLRIPRRVELRSVIHDLKLGHGVLDARFDAIYPASVQRLSAIHWTPVRVARIAAELLVSGNGTRILDVGSGAGKFCLAGALTTGGQFTGIEQRACLVELGQKLVDHYGVERVRFIHGKMVDVDWADFQGFYLYNPFVENLYEPAIRIDHELNPTRRLYEKYVRFVQGRLHACEKGTRVVTYHGFGGKMPAGYVCKFRELVALGSLELWVKE